MSDLQTIADLLEQQRTGTITAEALVADRLARIATDTAVRPMVEVDADGALATARRLDALRASGAPRGPLHGVPVTVKSSFAVAGLHASVGTEESRSSPSETPRRSPGCAPRAR